MAIYRIRKKVGENMLPIKKLILITQMKTIPFIWLLIQKMSLRLLIRVTKNMQKC